MTIVVVLLALAKAYVVSVLACYVLGALGVLLEAANHQKLTWDLTDLVKFLVHAWIWPVMMVRQYHHNHQL